MMTVDLEEEVDRPKAGFWPWGTKARIARAAKILKSGRFDKASVRYEVAWERLKSDPKAPAALLGAIAVGFAVCLHRQGRDDDLLTVCRDALKIGVTSRLLLDLPCFIHVKRRRIPSAADFQDIHAWLMQGAHSGVVSESEVERLLRASLRPWLGMVKGVGEWLKSIAKIRPHWSWPELHLAEWARCQQRFADAALALGRARAQNRGTDVALLWSEAECFFLAGDKRKAATACDGAWKAGPLHDGHAALAIECSITLKATDEAVGRLQLAFGRFGATVALCEAAQRLAVALDCWQQLRPVIETALAPASVVHGAAIGLLLRAAAALQDPRLATSVTSKARSAGLELTGVEAELAILLLKTVLSGMTTPRVSLIVQALGQRGSPLRAPELSAAAGARPTSAWARLAAEVGIRQLLANRQFGEAAERAVIAVGSAEAAALDPLLWAGAARALASGESTPAMQLVEACSDSRAKLWLSGSLLAQAVATWGTPGGRKHPVMVAAQLVAAQKFAALPNPAVAAFATCIYALAARETGGRVPALASHSGLVAACLAVAENEKNAAESAVRVLANGNRQLPLEQWLEKATARLLLARGDWEAAFALCRVPASARKKLLGHLGATACARGFAAAFDMVATGRIEDALDRGIKALAASTASPGAVTAAAELAVGLRQARGEAALAALRPRLYQALEAAVAAGGQRPTCPRWEPLAIAGLWSLAADALIAHVAGRVPSWHELASLAVLAAAAGREAGSVRSEEARHRIALSAGAYMAIGLNERSMLVRAVARIRAYQVAVDTPRIDSLHRALVNQTHEILGGLAVSCGIETEQLEMMLAVERAGAEALAKAGPVLAKNGAKVPPALGPLLISALGLRDSLDGVFSATTSSDSNMGDLFRQLAGLLGQEGLSPEDLGLPMPEEFKSDPTVVRAERLCSPLAPIVVLVSQKHYGSALSLLKTMVDSTSLSPVAKLVGSPADSMLAAYVSAIRHKAFFEGVRNYIVEVALEECRDLVAEQVPDMVALRKRLDEILAIALSVKRSGPFANGLAKFIVGRAVELFRDRTREDRIKDDDKRGNSERQGEALAILRCGLDVLAEETSEIRSPIEGKLGMYVNVLAVKAANAGEFKEAERLLLEALEINPANRAAAGNLIQVIMVQAVCAIEGKPLPGKTAAKNAQPFLAPDFTTGFKIIMDARKRMLSLALRLRYAAEDPDTARRSPTLRNGETEIFRMLDELGKMASTPFFNASQSAGQAGDHALAATRMIEASLTGPDDKDTEQGLMMLSHNLIANARMHEFERVQKHMMEERHGPKPEQRVSQLNHEANRLAARGRFADALEKIRQSAEIIPGLPIVAKNYQAIAQAWCEDARDRGDLMALAEAERQLVYHGSELSSGSPA